MRIFPLRIANRLLLLAGLVLCSVGSALSQLSTTVVSIMPSEAIAGVPLTLIVELRQSSDIEQVYLMARPFGSSEFRRAEMEMIGNQARVSIPARAVTTPFLEYYLVIERQSGTLETYPVSPVVDPFTNTPAETARLKVVPADQSESQVIFLSPDPGSSMESGDLVVSFSLLRADSVVAPQATQVLLDGQNVTRDAVFSNDLVVYVPANNGVELRPGNHTVAVQLFTVQGTLYHTATLMCTITEPSRERMVSPSAAAPFTYRLTVQAEGRRENVLDSVVTYVRGNYQFRGTTGIWTFKSNAMVTSDESAERQPQNRFFLGTETPWFDVGYGDAYPSFSELTLNGKRVRGMHASLHYDVMRIDMAWGQITRGIEGRLLATFPADSFAVEFARDTAAAYGPIDPTTWGRFSYGTYGRNLFAVRPSAGNNDTWEVGLTWLSASDDTTAIRYGIRPQQNVLMGLDFATRFDDRRIELLGQGAFSLFNSDFSSGTFSDSYIDSVYPGSASEIRRLRNTVQDFITVNENIRPLSLKKLTTMAYDVTLGLRYFDNALSITYLFRGSDYVSFGQSYLRTDIQGFTIVDRIRLLANQLFLTLGFEQLEDNTGDVKAATTVFTNVNVAVSYFPRPTVPSFTVGYSRYTNNNNLPVGGPDSLLAIDDVTHRFYLQSLYSFSFGARHTASLGISVSDRSDATIRQNDVDNASIELGFNTDYSIPLRTMLALGVHRNSVPSGSLAGGQKDYDYTMASFHARYSLIPEVLSAMITFAPTFGSYKRTVLELGSEWFPHPNFSILVQLSYFANQALPSESIMSLRCRYAL